MKLPDKIAHYLQGNVDFDIFFVLDIAKQDRMPSSCSPQGTLRQINFSVCSIKGVPIFTIVWKI